MSFGQFASTTQFYIYGKRNCTQTGYLKAKEKYPKPDIILEESLTLDGKVFIVTGANAGIGKEITSFLASKNASVYMMCRNETRGAEARNEIAARTNNSNVHLIVCDCSLEADVRRGVEEFAAHQQSTNSEGKILLHGLVCNAGALLNEKQLTSEGVEVTFAAHLLFGVYLLGKLAMPYLYTTEGSRLVIVSSGGMYNAKFPSWDTATATGNTKYDGQLAYAYAKRGQVLLAEKWQERYPSVKIVSCHPGWTLTEGVESAYGESKSYLEPLRTLWEGSEGIIWLLIAPCDDIQGGAFYLDRSPQVKHMAGPFFTEGSFTKNTPTEVNQMMLNLEEWSSGNRPTPEESARIAALELPLKATTQPVDIERFMGKWYVLAFIPTSPEVGSANGIESYEWDDVRKLVKVQFEYIPKGSKTKSTINFHGNIKNAPINTHWGLNPRVYIYVPIGLNYLILDVAEDYSYTVIGVPDRSALWIMTRERPVDTALLTRESEEAVEVEESTAIQDSWNATSKELKIMTENQIIEKCTALAAELGHDPTKIVRVTWLEDAPVSSI